MANALLSRISQKLRYETSCKSSESRQNQLGKGHNWKVLVTGKIPGNESFNISIHLAHFDCKTALSRGYSLFPGDALQCKGKEGNTFEALSLCFEEADGRVQLEASST
jgi:hypothetical protein